MIRCPYKLVFEIDSASYAFPLHFQYLVVLVYNPYFGDAYQPLFT
jgi:hypothetical protein